MTMGRIIILKTVRIYPLLCYFLTLEVTVWRFVVLFRCRESQIGKSLSAISISLPLSALPIFRKKMVDGKRLSGVGFPNHEAGVGINDCSLGAASWHTIFRQTKTAATVTFRPLRQSAENRPFQRQKTTISSPFTIPLSTLFGHPLPYPVFSDEKGENRRWRATEPPPPSEGETRRGKSGQPHRKKAVRMGAKMGDETDHFRLYRAPSARKSNNGANPSCTI